MTPLSIVFCSDDNYVQHLGTTIISILKNNPKNEFHFYILDGGISIKNKKKLEALRKVKSFEISFIPVSEKDFHNCYVPPHTHFTKAVYYRFNILSSVPVKEKVLYLDCDIICLGNLKPLFDIDFKGKWLAASEDYFGKTILAERNITQKHPYFNAGVVLYNLPICRQNNLQKKLFDGTKAVKILQYADQDVLNSIAGQYILPIDSKYNTQFQPVEPDQGDRILSQLKDVILLHYTSHLKPWNVKSSHPLNDLYLHYLKFTPWKYNIIKIKFLKFFYFIYHFEKQNGIKTWKIMNIPLLKKVHHKKTKYRAFYILGIPIFISKGETQ